MMHILLNISQSLSAGTHPDQPSAGTNWEPHAMDSRTKQGWSPWYWQYQTQLGRPPRRRSKWLRCRLRTFLWVHPWKSLTAIYIHNHLDKPPTLTCILNHHHHTCTLPRN
jgi:hypothetical protein